MILPYWVFWIIPDTAEVFWNTYLRLDMGKYRYAKDYAIREDTGENGRQKISAEYTAGFYEYDRPVSEVKRTARYLALLGILLWAAFLCGMILMSGAMKTLYAALPYATIALWNGLYTHSVLTLFKETPPLTHKQADLMNNQFPAVSMFACIFSAIALGGETVHLILGASLLKGDIVWIVCDILVFLCAAAAFKKRREISCMKRSGA